jgi:hypothetical protein
VLPNPPNPRLVYQNRHGHFTDKGTPEAIPGRKAKASVKAKGKRVKAKGKSSSQIFAFYLLPFAFTRGCLATEVR